MDIRLPIPHRPALQLGAICVLKAVGAAPSRPATMTSAGDFKAGMAHAAAQLVADKA